jgi:SH3-like domain-containing protein
MKFPSFILFLILTISLPLMSWSDTLLLQSGDQIIGNIISETDEAIVINVNGVSLTLQRLDVIKIIRKEGPGNDFTIPTFPETIKASTDSEINPSRIIPWTSNQETSTPAVIQDSTPQPLLPVILPKGKAYQAIGQGVRLRNGPSLEHKIIESLSGQSILIEQEFKDNWLHAKTINGVDGWVYPGNIRVMENLPCLVTGDRLHIREGADELTRSLARLRRGDVVVKLKESGEWWFVLLDDSKANSMANSKAGSIAGWCSKNFLMPLTDKNVYHPPMRLTSNAEIGMPIVLERKTDASGFQSIDFLVRNDDIVQSGKTKLIVFYRDAAQFTNSEMSPVSEGILQRHRLANAPSIVNAGLPVEIAFSYIGGEILTLLGERVATGWKYSIMLPGAASVGFGFVVQEGLSRGTFILIAQ